MEPLGSEGLAAIMLTDAVAFTRKVFRSEKTYLQILAEHLAIIQKTCLKEGGEVLKNTGDGLLVYFPSAHRALKAAKDFQTELTGPGHQNSYLHRVAIHVGDVYRSKNDVMGSGVNAASRLMRACEPGSICVSHHVHDLVEEMHGEFVIRKVRGSLDDFAGHIRAYRYQPRDSALRSIPTTVGWIGAGFLSLGVFHLLLPTFLGWDALWVADYQRAFLLLLLASIAAVHYPCGVVAVICSVQISRKPWRKPPLYRLATGLLLYAPIASIGLLQFVNQDSLLFLRDRWTTISLYLMGITSCFALFALWRRPWSIFLSILFLLSGSLPAHAQIGTDLKRFERSWDQPVHRGTDSHGTWGEYHKGKKFVRVWTDPSGDINRMEYRCSTFEECWKELLQNQNGDKWWEREYFEPSKPKIRSVVSTQWLRRPSEDSPPTARAVIEYELTSIFLFPPVCFFYRFFHDVDRPWKLAITTYNDIDTSAGSAQP